MQPSIENSREQARALIHVKDGIETEISHQISILRANNCDMTTALVDAEGFPRADLDIYAIRTARARIIQLRNDLKCTMDEIDKALQKVYDPALAPSTPSLATPAPADVSSTSSARDADENLIPFAKVDGVAPGSPAALAGLRREDLVTRFGDLTRASFSAASLQPLADLVSQNENRELRVQVLRDGQEMSLQFTPRSGWGGRGLLGCHIVPYRAS